MSYLWFGLSLTILLTVGSVLLALLLAEERYIVHLMYGRKRK